MNSDVLIALAGILVITGSGIQFGRRANDLLGHYRWTFAHGLSRLIIDKYAQLVSAVSNSDEIALAARFLIVGTKAKELKPLYLGFKVVFFGAAGNQSAQTRLQDSDGDESELSPSQVYAGAVEELMANQTSVVRTVSLLTLGEFSVRSETIQRSYLAWLQNQVSQLTRNENYVLLDNKRAPKWGAPGAMIITSLGILQFSGPLNSALFLKGSNFTVELVKSTFDDLNGALNLNRRSFKKAAGAQLEDTPLGNLGEIFGVDMLRKHHKELSDLMPGASRR